MCDFCTKHGEGKKWYLQAKNYDREILSEETRQQMIKNSENPEEGAVNGIRKMDELIATDFEAARNIFVSRVEEQKKIAWAQVVPLEDAEKIIDMSTGIVRMSCPCRKLRGVHDARFCFGLNTVPKYLGPIIESPDYSNDLEVLTKKQAKQAFREFDRTGLVHMVLTQTPFIKSICNCDATYCEILRLRSRFNYPAGNFYKSEYVATIDWEKCNGCRDCMKVCNFADISYSPAVEKCFINQFLCFGCGTCRSVCPTGAITLQDRNAIPALANEW